MFLASIATVCLLTAVASIWFPPAADRLATRSPLPRLPTVSVAIGAIWLQPWRTTSAVVLGGVVAWRVADSPWWTALVVPILGVAWLAVLVDCRCHRLPDVLLAPTIPLVGAMLSIGAVAIGEPWRARTALLAAGAAGGVLVIGWLIGMGLGDVKWGAVLALPTGWAASGVGPALHGGLAIVGLASVVAVVWRAVGTRGRPGAFAFGPFLFVAALAVLFVAPGMDV